MAPRVSVPFLFVFAAKFGDTAVKRELQREKIVFPLSCKQLCGRKESSPLINICGAERKPSGFSLRERSDPGAGSQPLWGA